MNVLLALLAVFAVEQHSPNAAPQLNSSRFANVVLKLYGDAELREAHAGYWTNLQAQPDWLEQEAVWWDLMRTSDLGPLLIRVDELLQSNPEIETRFNQFYTVLASNAPLRQSLEQFERAALKPRGDAAAWLEATSYLRLNASAALPLLGGISPEVVLPEALKPYAVQLMRGSDWVSLRDPLNSLLANAEARDKLLPWWQAAASLDAQHDGLFTKLATELLQKPNRFWALYRRELSLAANPALRDWVRWLHRRMRRETTAYADYLNYLSAIRSGHERIPLPHSAPWPGESPPPALPSIAQDRLPALRDAKAPPPKQPAVPEPARPEVARPNRPEASEMRQSERMKARD